MNGTEEEASHPHPGPITIHFGHTTTEALEVRLAQNHVRLAAERNYRLFASGQIVSNIGTWMQRVAQDWLVLELSARSPMALGIATALQFAPTLVLSAWAGMLADRMDKRKLEIVVQAGMGASALALGLLVVTNSAALWQVYLMCFLLGCFAAIDQPVRQSFVMEMVGKPQLPNAVALNSMTFNLARIVGPAIAGVLINLIGTGWVFLLNAGTFVAVITGLIMMDPAKLTGDRRRRAGVASSSRAFATCAASRTSSWCWC